MSGAGYATLSTTSMLGCISSKRLSTSRGADFGTILARTIEGKHAFPATRRPYPKKSIERARWVPLTAEIFEVSKGPVLLHAAGRSFRSPRLLTLAAGKPSD
jgi:hypothetical protein